MMLFIANCQNDMLRTRRKVQEELTCNVYRSKYVLTGELLVKACPRSTIEPASAKVRNAETHFELPDTEKSTNLTALSTFSS